MDKKAIKKIWDFIWHSDSILSWIVNIILAFLIIYFLVYPGLGLLFQTTHPIVAVVSGSMEHDGDFNDWWETQESWYLQNNITKEQFKEFPFKNGFNKGDLMVLRGIEKQDVQLGHVIVFKSTKPDPVIHRVVNILDTGNFQTKGDHNSDSFSDLGETDIPPEKIIGYEKYQKTSKAILRVPFLGWIKIWFVENPIIFILVVAIFIILSSNYEKIKKYLKD